MGEVIMQEDRAGLMSIARLAEAFGMARETVAKRLAMSNIVADRKRNGYPVYKLRDACEALINPGGYDEEGQPDPKKLPPESRNAWYQSEIRRMDVEMRAGQLIPAAEVEATYAELIKAQVQFLETLGDQLERDAGLSPEQVELVNESVQQQRQSLYSRMTEDVDVRERA
jgi:hypothetical protein